MYLLYSLLLTLGVIALLPRFIYDAFRHGKYVAGFRQRLGQLPRLETDGRRVIWLHCVSVGEALAARLLARALLDRFPSHVLVVSTTTMTGQRVARDAFRGDAAAVFYFPFDWAWTVRRALRTINPSAVLIMETELWPNFLRECRRRGVPTAVVNGRLSKRSFQRYKLIARFARRMVGDLDLAIMQTDADAERIRAIGLESDRALVAGNIKFDVRDAEAEDAVTVQFRERFQFASRSDLIVAASTHPPEERVVIEAFNRLRTTPGYDKLRMVIAPRHPERFEEVVSLLESSGLAWSRRSAARAESDSRSDVVLLDSIGDLRAVYPLAGIVFVGGSIARTGGHNILEPAAAGACVVTGAHIHNFEAIVEVFLQAEALIQLPDLSQREAPEALARAIRTILNDDDLAAAMVHNARRVLEANRGATARTIDLLSPILAGHITSDPSEPELARRPPLSV